MTETRASIVLLRVMTLAAAGERRKLREHPRARINNCESDLRITGGGVAHRQAYEVAPAAWSDGIPPAPARLGPAMVTRSETGYSPCQFHHAPPSRCVPHRSVPRPTCRHTPSTPGCRRPIAWFGGWVRRCPPWGDGNAWPKGSPRRNTRPCRARAHPTRPLRTSCSACGQVWEAAGGPGGGSLPTSWFAGRRSSAGICARGGQRQREGPGPRGRRFL
ncbi:hypothetical protein C8J57DRAFT_1277137 [Mycena rebaudengoi]|nr:hypothetical protein C8J57DRAFT_1277137 [Mycena rebaudengoi]